MSQSTAMTATIHSKVHKGARPLRDVDLYVADYDLRRLLAAEGDARAQRLLRKWNIEPQLLVANG